MVSCMLQFKDQRKQFSMEDYDNEQGYDTNTKDYFTKTLYGEKHWTKHIIFNNLMSIVIKYVFYMQLLVPSCLLATHTISDNY